jgi:two-component system response regulator DesR
MGAAEDRVVDVLVVDDHDVVHWGFKLLLSKQPWVASCATAASAAEALERIASNPPDVALIDLFLGAESGAELCEEIRSRNPSTRVLLVSGAGNISPKAAEAAGASGFVSKDWSAADITMAVRMVANGMTVFEPGSDAVPGGGDLSSREREVVALIATGATNREIAERLFLSPHTVKEYTSSVYRKLGARNRADAVRIARQLGIGG